MKKNREFRNAPTQIWSINFQQRYEGKIYAKQQFSTNDAGISITGFPDKNTELKPLPEAICKNLYQVDDRPIH